MMQTILLAFVMAWNAVPASSPLCFCVVPEVPESFERAKAVFVGEVIEIAEPATADEKAALADRLYVVRFKVEKSWKGAFFASEIDVLSDQGRGCFAYPKVTKGERYIVYTDPAFENGSESRRPLIITSCNRTAMLPGSLDQSKKRRPHLELDREDGSADLEKLDAIIAMPPKRRA
jgi:hypothetical protein